MRISDWSSDVCSSDLMIDGFVSDSRGIMSGLTGSGSALYGVISTVERLTGSVSSLLRLPRNLDSEVFGIVSGVAGLGRGPRSALKSSEERRVGKECVSTCRSRWSPDHYNKKHTLQH